MRIKVLGAGSWGTALALLLHNNGHNVSVWNWDEKHTAQMLADRENKAYLPGVPLPSDMSISSDLSELTEAEMILFVVPSHALNDVAAQAKQYIKPQTIIISAAKGFHSEGQLRLSQVIAQYLPHNPLAVLSGPTHAEEVGRALPTAIVLAGKDNDMLLKVQDIFMNNKFRVYTNSDIIGVEIGGAVKNVIALGAGIIEGLGLGDNSKAALITRGLAEIIRLGEAMGAKKETFSGLAGLGDLVVTAGSRHSRNFRAGTLIGQGNPWKEVLQQIGMVVEGVYSTENTYKLAQKYQVEMPITEQMYAILYEDKSPEEAMWALLTRSKKDEIKK